MIEIGNLIGVQHRAGAGFIQAVSQIAAPFAEAEKIVEEARAAYIQVAELGKTGGDTLSLDSGDSIRLAVLRAGFEGWFPNYMAGEEIPVTN